MSAGFVPRPWRRFLRFSVRGLIVLVLVIGAGLGRIVHDAHVQRDAVAAIRRAGGEVEYDCYWSNGSRVLGGEPRAPRWLIDLIGGDYFHHITKVEFLTPSSATDAKLAHVGRLSRLQLLSANYSPSVSNAGLAHLTRLTNLTFLWLDDTQVTDAGLAHLKGLSKLTQLNLHGSQVTDAGVNELQRALPNLNIVR
jgi:internalin A